MLYQKTIKTPLALMVAHASDDALLSLDFDDLLKVEYCDSSEILDSLVLQLDGYFSQKREKFDLPLLPKGSDFQRKVWQMLREIPYGKTISYKEEALSVGNPKACRAVANAS
mgnify:CR=1 FL=1